MGYLLYSDESGTGNSDHCYTIGALLVPEEQSAAFRQRIVDLKRRFNVDYEAKWERVRTSYGLMNFAIEVLREVLRSDCCFAGIVVRKGTYRKWQLNQIDAFYATYTLLIEFCARVLRDKVVASIDERSDRYKKHHEVVHIIANHKLKGAIAAVESVTACRSRDVVEIQAVDMLTGAINAGDSLFLNPDLQIHEGKVLTLGRLARTIGWRRLHHDTMPNKDFNIWHFPWQEYRNVPVTRAVIPDFDVPSVTWEDVKGL